MNRDSNKYIFLYSIGLVAASAMVLSVVAVWLAPFQQKNIETEKKLNILQAVRKADSADIVPDKTAYIEANYSRYITQSKIVNMKGAAIDGIAFEVSLDDELAKPAAERKLPVFICTNDDSSQFYILPLRGTGLWGPIWGYIALNEDMNTVYGVVFDHKGETPGLGAEIATQEFQRQFAGKKLFEGQKFTSIEVKKGGQTQGMPHAVDAVSGGTLTSEGLHKMLLDGLSLYLPFLQAQQKINAKKEMLNEAEPTIPAPQARPVLYKKADTTFNAAATTTTEQPQPETAAVSAPQDVTQKDEEASVEKTEEE